MPIKFSSQRQELCLFHVELEAGDPGFAHPGLCSFLFGRNIQSCGFYHQGGGKEPTVSCKSLMVPFVLLRNGESRAPAPPTPQGLFPHPPMPPRAMALSWQDPGAHWMSPGRNHCVRGPEGNQELGKVQSPI